MEAGGIEASLDTGSTPPELDELAGRDQSELASGKLGDLALAFGARGSFCLSLRINLPAVGHFTSLPTDGAHVGRSVRLSNQESVTKLRRPPRRRPPKAKRRPEAERPGRRWFLRSSGGKPQALVACPYALETLTA